jgi:hypothetical protein
MWIADEQVLEVIDEAGKGRLIPRHIDMESIPLPK